MYGKRIPVQNPANQPPAQPPMPNGGSGNSNPYPGAAPQIYYVQPPFPQYHQGFQPPVAPKAPRQPKVKTTKKLIDEVQEECDDAEKLLEITGRKNPTEVSFFQSEAGGQAIGMIGSVVNNALDKLDEHSKSKREGTVMTIADVSPQVQIEIVNKYFDDGNPELIVGALLKKFEERGIAIPNSIVGAPTTPTKESGPDYGTVIESLRRDIYDLKNQISKNHNPEGPAPSPPQPTPEPSGPTEVKSDYDIGLLDDTIPQFMKSLKNISDPDHITELIRIESSNDCRNTVLTALLERRGELEV